MLADTKNSSRSRDKICFYEQVVINLAFPEFPDAYQFAGMIHGTIITDGHSVQNGTSQMEKGQSLGVFSIQSFHMISVTHPPFQDIDVSSRKAHLGS